MTLANSVFAKASVAFVALATAFVLAAPAQAQMTSEQMQAEIDRLTALITSLTASLGGGTTGGSTSSACPYTWTRDLSTGSTGMDVMKLQQFLNSSDDTRVAAAGSVGSAGMETEYYGPATAAAVSKMQVKYRTEILAPAGLVNPTGYFGPSSRAKANMLCASAPTTPTTPTDPGTTDPVVDDTLQGGAGSIDDVEAISGISNEDVGEGESDVEVLGLEIEADNASDIMITALKLDFDDANSGVSATATSDLDDYIDEVSIWFEGSLVASFDVDEFDEDDDWDTTLSLGSNAPIIRAGDTKDLKVAVSAINNLDSADEGDTWEVTVNELRFRDGDNAVITDTQSNSFTEIFTVEDFASAADIELKVTPEDDTINDARTIPVDDSDSTDDVEVLSFSIEAEGNSDLEVKDLSVDFTSVGAGVGSIISSASVVVDGDTLDSENVSSTTATSRTITFTDVDLMIDAGDTVEVIIMVDIRALDGSSTFTTGDTLTAEVNPDDAGWDVEDENGDTLPVADRTGAATSDAHDFISSGLIVDFVSTTASQQLNLDSTSSDDQGKFEIVFTVEAFEDTAWIELKAASSTDADTSNVGAAFSIEDASDNTGVTLGTTTSPTLSRVSGGSVTGNFVRLTDGQVATFKLTSYYDAAATGSYRMQLNEIGFNQSSAASANTAQAVTPAEDYQSDEVQVLN